MGVLADDLPENWAETGSYFSLQFQQALRGTMEAVKYRFLFVLSTYKLFFVLFNNTDSTMYIVHDDNNNYSVFEHSLDHLTIHVNM